MNKTDRETMLNPKRSSLDDSFQWHVDNIDEETAGSFFENYIKAVQESGLTPTQFAKENNIDFKSIFALYYFRYICPDNVNYDDPTAFQSFISAGSGIIALCDFFGIKITISKILDEFDIGLEGGNYFGFWAKREDE